MADGHLLARYQFPLSTPGFQRARPPLAAAEPVGVAVGHSVVYASRAPARGPRLRFLGDAAGASSASFPRGASA